MPNRIIRESCRTSPTLAQLSHGAERFFWRLTTVADDFGRFEADPMVLLAQCFPNMLHQVKTGHIASWLAETQACKLVRTYVNNGKTYGFFITWEKHQTRRAKQSKHPDPPSDNGLLASANICEHMLANALEESRNRGIEESRKTLLSGWRPTAISILDWLNSKANRTYRHNPANLDLIVARLKDGIKDWQLKAIVSRKVREWHGTEQAKYLRPATLFNRTKCEQYLGELPPHTEADNGAGMS